MVDKFNNQFVPLVQQIAKPDLTVMEMEEILSMAADPNSAIGKLFPKVSNCLEQLQKRMGIPAYTLISEDLQYEEEEGDDNHDEEEELDEESEGEDEGVILPQFNGPEEEQRDEEKKRRNFYLVILTVLHLT